MGKSTISMAIFNSYVKLPEGRFKNRLSGYVMNKKDDTPNWVEQHFCCDFEVGIWDSWQVKEVLSSHEFRSINSKAIGHTPPNLGLD